MREHRFQHQNEENPKRKIKFGNQQNNKINRHNVPINTHQQGGGTMGPSKFPGKPSKLVTKKRVSVVNIGLKGLHVDNVSKIDGKYLPKYSASDQFDGYDEPCTTTTTTTPIVTSTTTATTTSAAAAVAAAATATSNSSTGEANKAHDGDLQTSKSDGSEGHDNDLISGSSKTTNAHRSYYDKGSTSSSLSTTKKSTKKKTVTFKNCLETSDDLNIVRKEPNLHITPPVPIIKKESLDCLSRATKVACGAEPIVLQSRLDEKLRKYSEENIAFDIDKLNSFLSKSSRSSRPKAKFVNSWDNGDDNEDDEDENGDDKQEKQNNSDDEDNDNESDVDGSNGADSEDDAVTGLKRMATKIRQSRRSKKPNKRFLDDVDLLLAKNGKKSSGRKRSSRIGDDLNKNDNFVERALSLNIDGNTSESKRGNKDVDFHALELKNNPFSKMTERIPSISPSSSKPLLRESKLSFSATYSPSLSASTIKENPFSSNSHSSSVSNSNNSTNSIKNFMDICGVCGSSLSKNVSTTPEIFPMFKANICKTCRKFITKAKNRFATDSTKIQCKVGDGNCPIVPFNRNIRRHALLKLIKECCNACWLKKCIASYRFSPEQRTRLINLLPLTMREIDSKPLLPFPIKSEAIDSSGTSKGSRIFSGLLNSYSRLPSRSQETNETDFKSIKLLPTNPLVENNVKFGSTPLLRPTISEKPTIMVSAHIEPEKTQVKPEGSTSPGKETNSTSNGKESKPPLPAVTTVTATVTTETNCTDTTTKKVTTIEPEEPSRLRNRKKDRTEAVPSPQPVAIAAPEPAKRQRIDLKGPRVKHVCRSASIVLGQPIATFPGENPIPEMDTPPRPDSPSNVVMELHPSTMVAQQQKTGQCKHMESSKEHEFTDSTQLSPPATPITNESDGDNGVSKEMPNERVTEVPEEIEETDTTIEVTKKAIDEQTKPITRKLTRPTAYLMRKEEKPVVKAPPLVSIDFWENYDPAEVSQTGFGLIVSEETTIKALCFLCGSCGQEPLMFCVCCCEPYHQYCVEDSYNMKHSSLDDTNISIVDTSIVGVNTNPVINRLNWMCPRCTVCDMCNMASGSKVKCQKCQKNYHSTCLGTSKRLLGADRPLICARCLKCKSCGVTTVSKFVGNLPMCSPCFRLRQKGNFCPLCQKCYEDNDFNIKMMECGHCQHWVHAKCEGLTDEQYNMLSVLPEHIEFICKKCTSPSNPSSSTWREAVANEFQAGLLSVVKLLSKSRQACALLRMSPRKKANLCTCYTNNTAIRCITFGDDGEEISRVDEDSQDAIMIDKAAAGSTVATGPNRLQQCFGCHAQKQTQTHSESLLDIKHKVMTNKYFSLADFNYDMNQIIGGASCEELMVAYKEILSETFPWFQNETKACTDALEEDMYDSCNFGQGTEEDIECDQEVPMVNIPDDVDGLFFEQLGDKDTRDCAFCKAIGDGHPNEESRMLYCGQNVWVHANCAMWSAEVFEEIDGSLQKVHSAISRGRLIKCSDCGQKGATVGCNIRNCGEHYHYPCARKAGCAFMINKTVFCPQHRMDSSFKADSEESNFEVPRAVYVELDRRKRKGVDPNKVQFYKGSLHIKHLGRFVTRYSDLSDAIVPAGFVCERRFWSTKEPWKMTQYTFRTYIQNDISVSIDYGRNFTVDHSTSTNLIQLGMAQIAKWHSNLANGDDNDSMTRQERSIKQILNGIAGHSEETNEDEPQSNTDLLPPEIKDAIFEDLPHDILDGISMLDIFPSYLNGDILKDGNMTDDDLSQNSNREFDSEQWLSSNMQIEDALLSAARPVSSMQNANRDLARTKFDCSSRHSTLNRNQSRPAINMKSSTSASAKRRRIMMDLPESVLLSLRLTQSDEIKNKPFTWSAISHLDNADKSFTPKDLLDKFKIPQLDGMDDISSGSEGDPSNQDYGSNTIFIANENPVKCDRCHCTYRTQDSYSRHLPTCETLSTSESDSELTSQTADIQGPPQLHGNMVLTSINGTDYCNIPMIQQHAQQQQPIFSFNGTTLTQMPQTIPLQNACQVPTVQGNGLPMQMQGMIINPTGALHSQQQSQQIFAQPITLSSLGQQLFPLQTGATVTTQPQMASFAAPQVITSADQQSITTNKTVQAPHTTIYKNPLILPQPDKNKKQNQNKISLSPGRNKNRPIVGKPVQIKKAPNQKADTLKPMQLMNQGMPIIRSMGGIDGNVIIQQANQQQQPLIVQQLAQNNQNNIVQYVAASDGNNGVQYFAMPTATQEYKSQPTQYLTPNPLIPGTFQLQSADTSGNLLLANTPTGLQVIQNGGTLQLAQASQPQVIGTLIQPQGAAIQCGMMSSEQMMLGAAPSFEMVTNPASGCMLLTNQPMYYGLETIVQNTVMQSQQFVSTAMQGVLSQNSSFSATTTQVFQASKIEPIMEMPGGYVVLNNDGTIMQSSTQQPILSTNLIQPSTGPAIQAQSNQLHPTQIQTTTANWRFMDDKIINSQAQPQPVIHQQLQVQPQIVQSAKPIIKSSPIVVSKIQPQSKLITSTANANLSHSTPIIVNQPKTSPVILPKPATSITSTDLVKQTIQAVSVVVSETQTQASPVTSMASCTIMTTQPSSYLPPMQKKTNILKPIGSGMKITSATIKPKIINKPVTSKASKTINSKNIHPHSTNPQVITVTSTNVSTSKSMLQSSIYTDASDNGNVNYTDGFKTPSMTIQQVSGDKQTPPSSKITDVVLNEDRNLSTSQKYVSPSQYLPKISEQVSNQISITPIPLSSSMTIIPTSTYNQHQQSSSQTQFTATVTSQSSHITHPLTSSIQLPQAPYAPSFSSGIPTNVVNPIQQHNHNNTRPTNRVLPMQTIQPKAPSPPHSSPEPKSHNDVENKKSIVIQDITIIKNDRVTVTQHSPNSSIILINSKPDSDEEMETIASTIPIDEPTNDSDYFNKDTDLLDSDSGKDSDSMDLPDLKEDYLGGSAEDAFDKLKAETTVLMIPSRQPDKETMDICTSAEVKEKISEILDNLEQESEDKSMMQHSEELYNLPSGDAEVMQSDTDVLEHKVNLNSPVVSYEKYQKDVPAEISRPKPMGPQMFYEIQSDDGFSCTSTSITDLWDKVFELVQLARKAHGLTPLPDGPLADMCGHQMIGLKSNAVKYLLEQLPGVENCTNYTPIYHRRARSTLSQDTSSGYYSDYEELKESYYGAARCEGYNGRSEYDMFSWLTSRHRKQPVQINIPPNTDIETNIRRGSSNLPKTMRYKTMKYTYKEVVGVYRSHIHGRGLFCNRDIEAGEMVIEYAGELIRAGPMTDKREKYYEGRGIGCYMFKIDEHTVVDATMRGNAARFINHSCEPNCYSKVEEIRGHKHIIIFALRRIMRGEELTYDYKFPFEETKIPCRCGSRKCRKYLN